MPSRRLRNQVIMKTLSSPRRYSMIIASITLALSSVVYVACDDGNSTVKEVTPAKDSGLTPPPVPPGTMLDPDTGLPIVVPNDSRPPPGLDCYPDPKTHEEIINACTDASRVDKKPVLPLLTADGGLPPLPM